MKGGNVLPDEVVDVWPEIFGEVTLNVLPVDYIEVVLINFKNGKSWQIEMPPGNNRQKKLKDFRAELDEMLYSYKDYIDEVDVKIDTEQIKKDVEKSIKKMLKKIKI